MAKIGLQMYTVRETLKTKEDVIKTLNKIKEIGYHTIQISGLKDFKDAEIVDAIADNAKALNLEICATHIPADLLYNDFEYVVNLHKKWQCKYVGLGSIDKDIREKPSIEGYMNYAMKLENYAKRLEEHDLKLIYHNHEFEFMKIDGKILYHILIENTKRVIFEVDVFWIQTAGFDPVKFLLQLKDRIQVIHLKDYAVFHQGDALRSVIRYAEIGEGNLNFPEIIETAIACGCEFMLIEQDDTYGKDPFECIKTSFDHVAKLGYRKLL